MAQLVMIILDDLQRLPALLEAWHTIGVPGVTILQSVGAHRTRTWLSSVGLGSLDRLFESDEVRRRTLLAVMKVAWPALLVIPPTSSLAARPAWISWRFCLTLVP